MVARSALRRVLLAGVLVGAAAGGVYFATVVHRTAGAYAALKRGEGWTGRIYEADPELGFRLVPGSIGTQEFRSGRSLGVRVDARGFRVPLEAPEVPASRDGRRTVVLALGSSETFGFGCAAEDAFPFLVAKRLDAECLDAACPSYGLAQVLVLARRLIPIHRPDIVLFQHSPWLADRSLRDTAPSLLQSVATPYFESGAGGIALAPPMFRSMLFDLPVERYLRSPRGTLDSLGFLARVGAPLLVHDDAARGLVWVRSGERRPPTAEAVAALVHADVAELCERSGALLVYVEIGKSCAPVEIESGARRPGVLVVDARAALCADLDPTDRGAYYRKYARFEGDPPALEDAHPNEIAHARIAGAIVDAVSGAR